MVALADGKPQTMGLKTIIYHYVNHQKDVITRRTKRELEIAEKRFHIVEGFIKAIDIMDDVIETIRNSKSKKDASENLVSKFEFTEAQAGAILELMLYRLTGLEIKVFKKEYNELKKLIKKFNKILSEEKELLKVVKSELEEVTEKFESPRKTDIIEDDSEAKIDVEELIVIEDVMVTLSNDGFIKRIPTKNYVRSNQDVNAIEYREGDELKFLFESNTTDNVLLFTDKGNMYQMKGINIPEGKWKDKGERIDTLIKINLEEEKIINVMSENILSPDKYVQFITNKGIIKKSSLDKFKTSYTKLQAIKLKENEEVLSIILLNGEESKDFLKVKTKLGLEFNLELPKVEDTPRNILGTSLFNISSQDSVIYCEYKDSLEYKEFLIGVTNKNTLKAFSKMSKGDNLKTYTDNLSDILLFTDKGNLIKIKAFILESVLDREIKISDVVDGIMKDENIIKIISLKDYRDDLALYSTTKKGLIKKTILSEFSNEFTLTQYYKLKYEDDRVVSIEINSLSYGEIVMITKKGMAIRFLSSNLNTMGKIASGVTGISLKQDDEVIYAKNILNGSNDELAITSENDNKFTLTSVNKVVKEVDVSDIKLQNRAGRGTDIMMTSLDDYIDSVQYN